MSNLTGIYYLFVSGVIEMDDLRPIKDLLKNYGGWPMTLTSWNATSFDLGSTLGDLIRIGSRGLLRFSVDIDRSNPSVKVSYVSLLQFIYKLVFSLFCILMMF